MKRLQEGDIIEIKLGDEFYADVPQHFLYDNRRGNFELRHGKIIVDDNFSYFRGKYVVYKTVSDGGGTGHNDTYPDGWHVYCENLQGSKKLKIDFYQSGSFTAMMPKKKAIGKANRTWTL